MISLNTSGLRISEIAKVLSKYPIKSNVNNNEITLHGDIPPECFTELTKDILELGIKISSISNNTHHMTVQSTKSRATVHNSRITQTSKEYNVIYSSPKFGEVYWVDFGLPFGYEEAFIRPALVVKGSGVFKSITTVIPLSSKVDRYKDSVYTPIFELSESNMEELMISTDGKSSCLLVEQMRAVDKSRLRNYIGKMDAQFMEELMKKIQIIFENKNDIFEEISNAS